VTPSNDERFVTTFGRVEGSTTTTQIRSYSQRYQGVASAQAAQAKALAVLQQAHAAAAVTSAGHGLSARHGSSCAGSTASLSVGLEAAGEQGAAAGYSSTDDSLRLSGQADSSGRGSCSSVGLCGEVGGRCGVAPLGVHTAAANILYVSGPCSAACETPRLGQTAAEAEAAWQCCETGKQEAELCSSGTSTEQPFHGSSSSCGTGAACRGSEAAVQAAPGRVSKAAAAAVQVLISYLDKALGLRVQGLVAEVSWIHGAPARCCSVAV
jgi:hypothetical protein